MTMIDYDRLRKEQDRTRRLMYAQEELTRFTPDNPPYLSDIYTRLDEGGQPLLIALEEQETSAYQRRQKPFTWKILVRRDEWGNIPQPGDVVTRRIPINRKNRDSQPTTSREYNAARVRGSFSTEFEQMIEYPVDEKGCIECTFSDAGYFLFNWGIHHKTNRGMCNKRELSTEPCKAPNGNMLHVHYWRYSEVDAADYEALEPRKKDDTKKRGSK